MLLGGWGGLLIFFNLMLLHVIFNAASDLPTTTDNDNGNNNNNNSNSSKNSNNSYKHTSIG